MNRLVQVLLLTAGSICVLLGVVGIVVPLFPTTPFLLLAAACYVRSSEKLYNRLLANRWFGSHIRSYRENRGIRLSVKITAVSFLWLTILFSIVFVLNTLWLKLMLALIAAGVTWHIVSIRTLKDREE